MSILIHIIYFFGGASFAIIKRIIITVPESLLCEVDKFTHIERRNRSEIVREAIMFLFRRTQKGIGY